MYYVPILPPSAKGLQHRRRMVRWIMSRLATFLGILMFIHMTALANEDPSCGLGIRKRRSPPTDLPSRASLPSTASTDAPITTTSPYAVSESAAMHPTLHLPLAADEAEQEATRDPSAVSFETDNSSVVTSQVNSNPLLPCVVRNAGDGMVSWIRRKDYHLLTVGLTTYSSDERFQAVHAQHSEDWTLQIKYVQPRDAGIYECQVSTHPPQSIFVTLRVVEARAEILGSPDKYVKRGSALKLTCVLRQSTEPPQYVFWYHNERMINYDKTRGVTVTSDRYSSVMVMGNAQKADSGNYSCVPSNANPANIFVHILNGENPAAMQHGGRNLALPPHSLSVLPIWMLSLLLTLSMGCWLCIVDHGSPLPTRPTSRTVPSIS